MLNWGLGYVIDLIAQIHQKVVETHRLSINRLLIAKTRARAWMIFQSVPHLRRSVRGLEAYNAERWKGLSLKTMSQFSCSLPCTVLVRVMYQLDTPIVRIFFQSCVASERELILACVGLFDVEGEDMVICLKHRALLGEKYCPSRKCQHPLHGRRKGKVSRGVNLKRSK